jgi:hypothetical protein
MFEYFIKERLIWTLYEFFFFFFFILCKPKYVPFTPNTTKCVLLRINTYFLIERKKERNIVRFIFSFSTVLSFFSFLLTSIYNNRKVPRNSLLHLLLIAIDTVAQRSLLLLILILSID